MRSSLASLLLVALATSPALAAPPPAARPLASDVTRVAQRSPSPVVIALRSAGRTAVERFASNPSGARPAGQPLVAILRAEEIDLGDQVEVVRAEQVGATIYVEVEERICMCGRTVSGPVVPYVEIALGALPAGDYTLVLRETQLTYSDELHPERASNPRRLLELQGMPLLVR
jgi:hypothetical protein